MQGMFKKKSKMYVVKKKPIIKTNVAKNAILFEDFVYHKLFSIMF